MKYNPQTVEELELLIDVILFTEPLVYGGFIKQHKSWKQYGIDINIKRDIKKYDQILQRCSLKILYMINKKYGYVDYTIRESGNQQIKKINIKIKCE